jgi:hypothetical protein
LHKKSTLASKHCPQRIGIKYPFTLSGGTLL